MATVVPANTAVANAAAPAQAVVKQRNGPIGKVSFELFLLVEMDKSQP